MLVVSPPQWVFDLSFLISNSPPECGCSVRTEHGFAINSYKSTDNSAT